jgi:outer membrane receptor protein involved in Fe transport
LKKTPGLRLAAVTAGVAIAAMCFSGLAMAQVDEIIVTARKKEEVLQDVPVAVTAFDAAAIDRKGIRGIDDLAKYSASLQFDESFAQSDTRVVIRGLSPSRGRQNVAFLVDGFDLSSEAVTSSGGSLLINTRLLDVERIEVVKGPQLALYGRAAFNGAIQYITKKPSDEFEMDFKVDANNEDQYSATGSVSFPVVDQYLGVRLNGAVWDEEGFYENSITGDSVADKEGFGLSLSTRSDFDNGLTVSFRAEYTSDEGRPSAQLFLPFNTVLRPPEGALPPNSPDNQATRANLSQCYSLRNPIDPTDSTVGWTDPRDGFFYDFTEEGRVGFIETISLLAPAGPAGDKALVERARRIITPELATQLGFPDPATATLADYQAVVAANPFLSPYCEQGILGFNGEIPDGDELKVGLAPNPSTPGQDYEGFDRDLWRVALTAEWALPKGTVLAKAGYLRDDNTETQDTNTFAFPANNIYGDGNVNSFTFNNAKVTEQTSFELRYQTAFDGPVNMAVGAQSWQEKVENDSSSITGQGSGSHCFWNSATGTPVLLDPTFCTSYTETIIAPYQAAVAQFRGSSPVDRDTDHWSLYTAIDVAFAETWTLTLEGRYNYEEVTVEGPVPYDPGASGGPGGLNPCGIFFRPCIDFDTWVDNGNWFSDQYDPFSDPELNDTLNQSCVAQDPVAVRRSQLEGPVLYEPELDGSGNPVIDPLTGGTVPRLNADGEPIPVIGPDGRAVLNPDGIDTFNPWCLGGLKQDESWFSPKITLDWKATENSLFYFSWADARKPGGFSTLTIGSSFVDRELAEFDPEKMEVWEIGGKTDWLDNTLRVNGAVFFQDYTDKQALTSAPGNDGRLVSKIANAGGAEAWGAEIDVTWAPISTFLGGDWTFTGSYTWLDAEYTEFLVTNGSPTTTAIAGNCTATFVQTAEGPEGLCVVSYSGNKLEDAPEGSFVGSIRYGLPIGGDLEFFIEADAQWKDSQFTDITNKQELQAYWNADMQIGLLANNWEVLAYVTNLFDDDTVRSAGGGPGLGCCFVLGSTIDLAGQAIPETVVVDLPLYTSAFLPPPRVIGVRASYRFGGDQ